MTTETPLLSQPAQGIPAVVDTVDAYTCATQRLAAGTGPTAIDAERASGIRYGQRAFLIQMRREGTGTLLLDSETLGDLSELGAGLGTSEWVIHSATQDLPCLQERGLRPAALFDTELAAKLLGYQRFGLGSVVEQTLGLRLAKEHSAVDWSTRPLPVDWLNYAALDVEVLLPIRDALAGQLREAGRDEFARQEFTHLLDFQPKHVDEPWRRTHGLAKVKSRRTMAIVRELWTARDELARAEDIAPSRLFRDRVLLDLAFSRVRSSDEIMDEHPNFSRALAARAFRAIRRARQMSVAELPTRTQAVDSTRSPFSHTERRDRTATLKSAVAEVAAELGISHDVLLQPALVKELAVSSPTDDVAGFLTERAARPWQIEHTAGVLESALQGLPRS